MYQGTILRLTDKGFGFISIEGMEKDIFFHASLFDEQDISFNELDEGMPVMCEYEENDRGLTATKVEVMSGQETPATEEAPAEEAETAESVE